MKKVEKVTLMSRFANQYKSCYNIQETSSKVGCFCQNHLATNQPQAHIAMHVTVLLFFVLKVE